LLLLFFIYNLGLESVTRRSKSSIWEKQSSGLFRSVLVYVEVRLSAPKIETAFLLFLFFIYNLGLEPVTRRSKSLIWEKQSSGLFRSVLVCVEVRLSAPKNKSNIFVAFIFYWYQPIITR
jgi:hypothetical protein